MFFRAMCELYVNFSKKYGFSKKIKKEVIECKARENTTRKTIEATKLAADDALVTVTCISDAKTVLLVSKNQLCVAFEISGISLLKKTAAGVIGIKLAADDEVVYADMVTDVSEFVLNDKIYRVSSIAPGKRGTRGRPL